MIKSIKREPIIKKSILIISISTFISLAILNIFHIYQLDNVYKQHIYTQQSIVGSLVSKYPEEEDLIMKSIKDGSKKEQAIGERILKSYGYNESNSIIDDDRYSEIISNTVEISIIFTMILFMLNLIIVGTTIKYILKIWSDISDNIDKMLKGNYKLEGGLDKEGTENLIYSQLNVLGNSLYLEFDKLNIEKENIKSLVTDISHQLKTPLASFKLNNALIIEENDDKYMRLMLLNKNEQIINKLNYLIDALVNISRLEASMISIKIEKGNIKDTVIRAISSAYIKALDKDIEIELNKCENININHDIRWSEEAIFNVIENAIKYSSEGSKIKIDISKTINYVRIDIQDNGIGIKEEEYNEIFKRFYRGNTNYVKNIEGSGVGLYLSRKIIEKQGGNIIVKSKLDEGSKFSLFFQL
ncbi:two-component sensor histidine kinase [[Clostridium] sordellii]|uniref:sensor histidine kinase n=1 Tax=Paraclostridium sordellii TaxID=1505 RepID=UPI0005DE8173|nr:HAMP domain-containing sensor histidine kinase [Paeniclostridium sordellii]CEN91881.1 two-component sensor histidine kinase [[Clostridium] sordellii] [Paeniclostridium sordellii]